MAATMQITCETDSQFYCLIQELVERGLGFNADANSRIVMLTGAY
jgi:hypothetical protein